MRGVVRIIYVTFIVFNLFCYYFQVFKDESIHFCFATLVVTQPLERFFKITSCDTVLIRRWWLVRLTYRVTCTYVRNTHECRCQLTLHSRNGPSMNPMIWSFYHGLCAPLDKVFLYFVPTPTLF